MVNNYGYKLVKFSERNIIDLLTGKCEKDDRGEVIFVN